MIFDKLENGLRSTPFKCILEGVYGGKSSSQLICSSCGHVKEKFELFYNLSLAVKGMKNLYESFEKLIESETINDFECEECRKKVDFTKRLCLYRLPNVLII